MTSQEPEILFYKGKQYSLTSTPLEQYFSKNNPRPEFQMTKTSNWRGYLATWEIIDQKLFISKIEGIIKGGEPVSLSKIFPHSEEKVFASWVSSDLIVPDGKLLNYVHMGFESVFERDIILTIKKGLLVKEIVRENKKKGSKIPNEPRPPIPPKL